MSELVRAINSLSTCLNNPASGGGSSFRLNEASEVLALLGRSDYDDDFEDLADLLETLVVEGRGPSPAEWEALRSLPDDAEEESVEEESSETQSVSETGEGPTPMEGSIPGVDDNQIPGAQAE